jgi:hypothetical protein
MQFNRLFGAKFMRTIAASLCVVIALSASADAGLILNTASLAAPSTLIDFSQFGSNPSYIFTAGPVQVGGLVGEDVVYTSTTSASVIGGQGSYGLGQNGAWNGGRNGYLGINSPLDTITLRFNSGPVSGVGGLLNYGPDDGSFIISALASNNSVLETYLVSSLAPISTPNGSNLGAFRGISRATADIYGFSITGAFGVLDDLRFTRALAGETPEPTSIALLGMGAIGFARIARRRKTS